jgi:predicted transcriptional regulator
MLLKQSEITKRLASLSPIQLYEIISFYGFIKKWIINSPNYTGDGHYLINTRPLIYSLQTNGTDERYDRRMENFYCFDSSHDSEEYYPVINIPDDELEEPLKSWMEHTDERYCVGISMKSNIPKMLIFHGDSYLWNEDIDIDQTAYSLDQIPKAEARTVRWDFEWVYDNLGVIAKDGGCIMERCSNDSWAETIPSFYIKLPHERNEWWIVEWAVPELLNEGHVLPKEKDYPDRKDLTSWKEQIKERDIVCKCCGGEKHLVCHHVYPFKSYPELRDDPNNGVLLCKWCHLKYHSYYGNKENVNPSTLMEFVQRFGNGATQSHVTTVEHVQQVLKGDAHMSKKGKLEQIIEIIKGYNQDDQPCTMVELFKDSNLTMLKLEELLDALAVKGVVYQFPEGQYHVA